MESSELLDVALYISLGVMSLALVVAFGRVLKGPSLPDRVVAIDYVSYITMGFLGTYAILSGREAYIDAALVLGLLAFIGTIALARYVEGRSGTSQHARAYQKGEFHAHGSVGGHRTWPERSDIGTASSSSVGSSSAGSSSAGSSSAGSSSKTGAGAPETSTGTNGMNEERTDR